MKEFKEITHYAGLDWAKGHHLVVIVDRTGKIVEQFTIEHKSEGWKQWHQRIATYESKLAVAIETGRGAIVEQLLQSACTIYPIQPLNAKRFRERKISSGNKTDFYDSWAIADALRVDGHGWRPLAPQDPSCQ